MEEEDLVAMEELTEEGEEDMEREQMGEIMEAEVEDILVKEEVMKVEEGDMEMEEIRLQMAYLEVVEAEEKCGEAAEMEDLEFA